MSARRAAVVLLLALPIGLAGCSTPAPDPGPIPTSAPTPTAAASPVPTPRSPASSSAPPVPEPTTTNTLPPPPAETLPAPTTSGPLTARSLPIPAGWRTAATKGGPEEGYLGNGTWVHGRDPRYAAYETITVGCASVTRDDYADPVAALEGTYVRRDDPGIGLVLEFADAARAQRYYEVYADQLRACTGEEPLRADVTATGLGLVDRRTYPDGDWTEVVRRVDRRVTMIILADPGHRITDRQTAALLTAIGSSSRR